MITLIVAHDLNHGIGINNALPWNRISEDMKRFKQETEHGCVVMGRKTFESLGRNLPNRDHMVITRTPENIQDDPRVKGNVSVWLCKSVEDAFGYCQDLGYEDIHVIGGSEIYNQTIDYAQVLLITKVNGTFEVDTSWQPDLSGWTLVSEEPYFENEHLIRTFIKYYREAPVKTYI